MDNQAHAQHSQQLDTTQQQPLEQQEAPAVTQLAQRVDQLALASPQLPYDVVHLVLKQVSKVEVGPHGTALNARERLETLSSAALVCSAWREPAQALMWEHVELESDNAMEHFLLRSDKQRRTSSLRIGAERYVSGTLAEKAIKSCRGLESLELSKILDFDTLVFGADSLADLKHLGIGWSVYFQLKSFPPMELPFTLDHLRLDGACGHSPSDIPPPLLAALLSKVTSELDFDLAIGSNHDLIPVVGPTSLRSLQTLRLGPSRPPSVTTEVYRSLVQQCTTLHKLTIRAGSLNLLYDLSPTVQELRVCDRWHAEETQELLLWLASGQGRAPGSFPRLEVLQVEELYVHAEWREAEEACKTEGIAVKVGRRIDPPQSTSYHQTREQALRTYCLYFGGLDFGPS